ncbi:MAG TPA: glycosyltransferase N-terminal domain-containing protein [Gemmatimonadaceae bacterium]
MNGALRFGYGVAVQLARAAAAVTPRGEAKVMRALAARRGIRERYAAWGAAHRDPSHPLLWMHAPSVGEGLQARPVLELARRIRPDLQLAYTHFSPSALRFAASLDVDFRDYLPFDAPGDVRAALDALRPTALVFSKLDVWPNLVREAAARGVRLGMVSATLAAGSSRRSVMARALLRGAYARLDAVGAVDASDADRLVALGVRPEAITVTGDTRYDQVWQRAASVDRGSALLAPFSDGRPTLVAGSTWPADERPLLDAWLAVRGAVEGARLVIAPHEPTAAHLAPIEQWAARHGIALARLGDPSAGGAEVVLVDRVGVLGDLYAIADAAFVGGGFHDAGLHSVLEPAAFGVPVLYGPRYSNSRDAVLLLANGGGVPAGDAGELQRALGLWLGDRAQGRAIGDRARGMVRAGLGAARRSFELVLRLVG